MISNLTTCDLCAAPAPTEKALDFGFARIVLQGQGPGRLRPLVGDGAHLDLCKECLARFLAWAAEFKAKNLAPPGSTEANAQAAPVAEAVLAPRAEPAENHDG